MKFTYRLVASLLGLLLVAVGLVGCGSDDNRQPTQAEIKAADVNRQKLVDDLNIPEDQKAQMRAHMGGPAAPDPAAAARAAAGTNGPPPQAGRRGN